MLMERFQTQLSVVHSQRMLLMVQLLDCHLLAILAISSTFFLFLFSPSLLYTAQLYQQYRFILALLNPHTIKFLFTFSFIYYICVLHIISATGCPNIPQDHPINSSKAQL